MLDVLKGSMNVLIIYSVINSNEKTVMLTGFIANEQDA